MEIKIKKIGYKVGTVGMKHSPKKTNGKTVKPKKPLFRKKIHGGAKPKQPLDPAHVFNKIVRFTANQFKEKV